MTKRILQIIPTLDRTGAQQQMNLLARGLPRPEFDVHICALSDAGPTDIEPAEAQIPLTVIGKRWRLDPEAFRKLHCHVARLRPDLIHSWLFEANAYAHAVSRTCGVQRLVVNQRFVDPRKSRLESAVDRHIARRCRAVVVASPAMRDFYTAGGLPIEKIRVIPGGIRQSEPDGTTRRQLLDELGLPESSRLIGYVGRLLPRKRVKDAIWATDLLKVIRDDVHLLILGDGPHCNRLHKFRDQVEIRDKVHFLGQRNDVARIMPHFDVLLSTAEYGGQSVAVMEAMAAAVPVVATATAGTGELVEHDRTGYLVPVGSRAEIAKHANYLLNDPERAERFGLAGRQRMLDHFGADAMIQQYVQLYRELLG